MNEEALEEFLYMKRLKGRSEKTPGNTYPSIS